LRSQYYRSVRVAIALAAASWVLPLLGQEALVKSGNEHFYNLEFDEALTDFRQAEGQNPGSPALHNHVAQTLLFREMFRDGALESELVSGNNSFLRRAKLEPPPETEAAFLGEIARAMSLCEEILKANPNDTKALFALGVSYGLRANYYWLVKKSWHDSLRDATSARRLHNRITEIEPGNEDARLVQGLHDYIIGSLPLSFRLAGFLIGIHGDKQKGIRTVQDVARNGKYNNIDAQVFLCALYRRENQPRNAIPLIEDLIQRFPRNYLFRVELSQMYSMAGDGQRGLSIMEEVARLKAQHAPGSDKLSWQKIYFQEGTIQFWYRDFDRALENLKKVAAAREEVDLNTGVQTYLRMGQIYDLTRRRAEALTCYRQAIALAPEAGAAQECRRYLSTPYRRL
jgi:tetratricopeptide (TPR) repeat protein